MNDPLAELAAAQKRPQNRQAKILTAVPVGPDFKPANTTNAPIPQPIPYASANRNNETAPKRVPYSLYELTKAAFGIGLGAGLGLGVAGIAIYIIAFVTLGVLAIIGCGVFGAILNAGKTAAPPTPTPFHWNP